MLGKEETDMNDKINLKDKINRCKYCHLSVEPHSVGFCCTVNGWEDESIRKITKHDCDNCTNFESRYIEYPIVVQNIENEKINTKEIGHKCGCLCEVRPCGEEYKGKTFLGLYLGRLPIAIHTSFERNTGVLRNSTMNNPAIFVPELKKIIYGYESWWREIQNAEDFKGITEKDIHDAWYVKLLEEFSGSN